MTAPATLFDPYEVDRNAIQSEGDFEDYLADCAAYFYARPAEFVMWAFDWGFGELKGETGLDEWQREFFEILQSEIEDREFDGVNPVDPVQMSVGSGHGIGKSALVAWIILWIMFTRPWCKGSITASTVIQLQTKTIPELTKWHRRFIAKHWFKIDTLKVFHVDYPKNWRADFLTSAKENSEAFAGQHAAESTSFYIMDESSGVPDEIDEVARGGLTDGEPMYFKFGNRTKVTGHFNKTFRDRIEKVRWITMTVNSLRAKKTNKKMLNEWIESWGRDSDFCRVRIFGLDPKQSSEGYFSAEKIAEARTRPALARVSAPLVMGVDVARYGEDRSCIVFRKGRDARTHRMRTFRKINTMDLADIVAAHIKELQPNRVFVDGTGVGGGVVDRLVQMGYGDVVVEVNFGSSSTDPKKYFNKRTEMYGRLRDAVHSGGLALEDSDEMEADLMAQEYFIDEKRGCVRLISKEDMKKIGEHDSPDCADALALTYAENTASYMPDAGGAAGGLAGSRARQEWHPFDTLDDSGS